MADLGGRCVSARCGGGNCGSRVVEQRQASAAAGIGKSGDIAEAEQSKGIARGRKGNRPPWQAGPGGQWLRRSRRGGWLVCASRAGMRIYASRGLG